MPGVIIGISIAVFLTTFPLNRLVGRTFVPDEDMGEWTIHLDAPEGTSLEGTSEMARQLVKELGDIKGVQDIEPSVTQLTTHLHLLVHAAPFESRTASQDEMIAEMRRRLRAHPSYRPSFTIRNSLGGGEQGGFPINAKLLGPDLEPAHRLFVEAVCRRATCAQPDGSQTLAEHLEPGDPCRGGSQAGGRPWRQNGHDRRRASPRGGRRR